MIDRSTAHRHTHRHTSNENSISAIHLAEIMMFWWYYIQPTILSDFNSSPWAPCFYVLRIYFQLKAQFFCFFLTVVFCCVTSVVISLVVFQIIVCCLFRDCHAAVFISAHISSPSVNNCPRCSQGQLSTEGLIYRANMKTAMWWPLYRTIVVTYSSTNQLLYLS